MVLRGHHNPIILNPLHPMGSALGRAMQNEALIREIASRACSEALQEKSQEIATNIAQKIGVALASSPVAPERTKELRDGTVLIAGSRTQTETLETLLAACSGITPECGLLILRGAQASGWNCHGITSLDNFRRATLDCSRGTAAMVISSCKASRTKASELDPVCVARLGLGSSAEVLLVPVLLKERVAALLLAVSQHTEDLAGLELLVQVAQLALDLHAYRKTVPNPQSAAAPPQPAPVRAAESAVSEPTHRSDSEPVYAVSTASRTAVASSVQSAAPTFHGNGTESAHPPVAAPVADEAHERARRFAKLLVEEIKLYNQTKVAEGRARGDLYSRLRDDIEKSRTAYQKRYGETVRDVDYFTQELMRILADNKPAVMGAGFPG
jgi:hypothetical protein